MTVQTVQAEEPVLQEVRQWTMYWVVYVMFLNMEFLVDTTFFWFPLYYPAKLFFLLWCFLPQFRGATWVFERVVQPLLGKHEDTIDASMEEVAELVKEAQGRMRSNSEQLLVNIRSRSTQYLFSRIKKTSSHSSSRVGVVGHAEEPECSGREKKEQ